MVNGRNKGAAFEREVCKMLHADLGATFKRDIEQYRAADHGDIICDDPSFPFTLELKRYANGYTYQKAWWTQVEKAAQAAGKEPVLIYKYDRQDIVVVMRLAFLMQEEAYDPYKVKLDWDGFMQIARETWNDPH